MDSIKRDEVVRQTLAYLEQNPRTSQLMINQHIERQLLASGEVKVLLAAEEDLPPGVYVPEGERYLMNRAVCELLQEGLAVSNRAVWDLIIDRVVTPGIHNSMNSGLVLSVTDPGRLRAKLSELSSV
ncbi:MAG: hypothetical protein QHH02_00925 [Syntrophomonadaceae bacterium]|nr:hypothetical protein [Syntrophomonadaceae bacterium]